jgi:hypothetical protein
MQHEDHFLESVKNAQIDAFLSDCQNEAGLGDLEKSLRAVREEEEVDRAWNGFIEELEINAATGGRSNATPRLRSEQQEPEPESSWRPGDDPDGGPLEKRYNGKLTKTVSESGWTTELNEKGEIVRAYAPGVNPEVFEIESAH